jgi:peptidoglycan/xylan/chitin deacetylase (PgdA/CDA1 family)
MSDDGSFRPPGPPKVVIRIDDVQDYAFRDAHMFLLRYNLDKMIPSSLAVITSETGLDEELLPLISDSLKIGAEVTAHGWGHEDLSTLTLAEQENAFIKARSTLYQLFGVNTTILVPPMFLCNNDTLVAMHVTGYDVLSTTIDYQAPVKRSDGIVFIPANVEFSYYLNDRWVPKTPEDLMEEVDLCAEKYGYVVLVIHAQELVDGEGELNAEALRAYDSLLTQISSRYSFTTLGELSKSIR